MEYIRYGTLDLRVVVHGVFLVSGAEVEDPPLAAGEGDAGAEHLATGEGFAVSARVLLGGDEQGERLAPFV